MVPTVADLNPSPAIWHLNVEATLGETATR
jgi:hypothetical protein